MTINILATSFQVCSKALTHQANISCKNIGYQPDIYSFDTHTLFAATDWYYPVTPVRLHDASEGDSKLESDVLLADPELVEPPMYAVVMYNDNYTPMEFVVEILQVEFRHSLEQAVEIMLNIHHNGQGMAGVYPKDIAETKAKKVNNTARKEGYPLLTQIEPHLSS